MPKPYRIILVEDEPVLAELLERLVRRRYPDAEVTTYWSGQDALDAYTRTGADALLVDRGVPGVDGLTITAMLRAQGDPVPIIGMSGDPAFRDRYLAAGASAFLSGSELFDQVIGLLEQLLSAPREDHG